MKHILIAGGSGLVGSELAKHLTQNGYNVKILSRKRDANFVFWNPITREIDSNLVKDTEVLINLSGAGIDEKRWTTERMKELANSRIETTLALFAMRESFPNLKQYISASGISAYGFDDGEIEHDESDPYGTDFLSQLVKKWEESASQFDAIAKVAKVRIAIVLSKKGGALPKLIKPIKFGIGSPIGSGNQQIPWVHIEDLTRIFEYLIATGYQGTVNANASNASNAELVNAIAKQLKKTLWFPKVPGFAIKLIFGEMAQMLLQGAKASNNKLLKSGFEFNYPTLHEALKKEL